MRRKNLENSKNFPFKSTFPYIQTKFLLPVNVFSFFKRIEKHFVSQKKHSTSAFQTFVSKKVDAKLPNNL
ncbi:hypothetical protein LEP1GSC005_0411 [Leptospira santarosai str. ST188]|nr:hypothetical protein LEP1GSC005_0411 [Leptospira santarosai str. ST188]